MHESQFVHMAALWDDTWDRKTRSSHSVSQTGTSRYPRILNWNLAFQVIMTWCLSGRRLEHGLKYRLSGLCCVLVDLREGCRMHGGFALSQMLPQIKSGRPGSMAHACYPNYLGGRDQEDLSSRPAHAKTFVCLNQ
jgi:hypothetical protein